MVHRRVWTIRQVAAVTTLASAMLWFRGAAQAQSPNQFGGQDRADAASRMIVLAVQQGLSSLPPTSAQSFTYRFDPAVGEYIVDTVLGPTAFRSPQTVGAGRLSMRAAASYFELGDSLGPIPYALEFDKPVSGEPLPIKGAPEIGTDVSAKVGTLSFSGTYGIGNRFELDVSIPIVVVDAQASNVYSTLTANLSLPPRKRPISGPAVESDNLRSVLPNLLRTLNSNLGNKQLVLAHDRFSSQGFQFNDGTQAGVGRISVGAKGLFYTSKLVDLAFAPKFFCPSPNEAEFAGPASPAILPRLISGFPIADKLRVLADVGYNYDFDNDELRAFVWNVGASTSAGWATVDIGVGGSKYNQGIAWTPTQATFVSTLTDQAGKPISGTITALGDNRLGTNFVDFLGGIKVHIAANTVISGAVDIPLTDDGVRPVALGTLAIEYYFQ